MIYECSKCSNSIGDVANWKRHQRLDKILIFSFTRTTLEKSAKLFSKKNFVMQYARETEHNPVCAAYACYSACVSYSLSLL